MNISTSNIRYRLKEKIQLHLKEQSPTGKQRTSDEQGVPSAPQAPSVGDQNTSAAATQQAQDYTKERDDAKNQPWYDKVMNNPIVSGALGFGGMALAGAAWKKMAAAAATRTLAATAAGVGGAAAAETAAGAALGVGGAAAAETAAGAALGVGGAAAETAAGAAATIAGSSVGAIAGTVAGGLAIGGLAAYGVNKGIDSYMGYRPGDGLAARMGEWDTINPISIVKGFLPDDPESNLKRARDDFELKHGQDMRDADAEGKAQTAKFDAEFKAKGGTEKGLRELEAGRTPDPKDAQKAAGTPAASVGGAKSGAGEVSTPVESGNTRTPPAKITIKRSPRL